MSKFEIWIYTIGLSISSTGFILLPLGWMFGILPVGAAPIGLGFGISFWMLFYALERSSNDE